MITIVTDIKHGEPDVLKPIQKEDLYLKDLDDGVIFRMSPIDGSWTHESLVVTVEQICKGCPCDNGADAFLGNTWIGSTEV